MVDNLMISSLRLLFILIIVFFASPTCSDTNAGGSTPFDGSSAFQYLEKICSFGTRAPGLPEHKKCRDFLIRELRKFTERAELQPFTHFDKEKKKTIPMYNILSSFTAKPPSDTYVMLCAHWESRPFADMDPDPKNREKPIIGANDNAGGVAILLELARHFHTDIPPVNVDIVLFDGEDYGREGDLASYFLGSRYFVKHLPSYSFSYAILLDMISEKDLHIPREAFSHRYMSSIVDMVWKRAKNLSIPVFENRIGPEVLDDHRILAEAGIPAIDIIDFDYQYWHTLEDTPDKCSLQSMQMVGDVIYDLIYNP